MSKELVEVSRKLLAAWQSGDKVAPIFDELEAVTRLAEQTLRAEAITEQVGAAGANQATDLWASLLPKVLAPDPYLVPDPYLASLSEMFCEVRQNKNNSYLVKPRHYREMVQVRLIGLPFEVKQHVLRSASSGPPTVRYCAEGREPCVYCAQGQRQYRRDVWTCLCGGVPKVMDIGQILKGQIETQERNSASDLGGLCSRDIQIIARNRNSPIPSYEVRFEPETKARELTEGEIGALRASFSPQTEDDRTALLARRPELRNKPEFYTFGFDLPKMFAYKPPTLASPAGDKLPTLPSPAG